jgi:hypothetical protein
MSHKRPRRSHRKNHRFQWTTRSGAARRWDKRPIHAMSYYRQLRANFRIVRQPPSESSSENSELIYRLSEQF